MPRLAADIEDAERESTFALADLPSAGGDRIEADVAV